MSTIRVLELIREGLAESDPLIAGEKIDQAYRIYLDDGSTKIKMEPAESETALCLFAYGAVADIHSLGAGDSVHLVCTQIRD